MKDCDRLTDEPGGIESLFDKAIENRLDAGERERLEDRVINDASVRRSYVDYLLVHAELASQSAALPNLLGEPAESEAAESGKFGAGANNRLESLVRIGFGGFAIAAAVATGFAVLWFRSAAPGPESVDPVATLIEADGCRWAGSELPTVEGATLSAGRLNLVEGLATLRFQSGAVVSLEAPVSLDVVSPMLCRLVSGSVVAEVPEEAHGFAIETPDMRVIDHGTRFGVTASELGQSQVFVFEGRVEVDSNGEDESRHLIQGQSIRLNLKSETPEQEPARNPAAVLEALGGDDWTVIPTSAGKGKDAFVRHDRKHTSEGGQPLVMVKHTDIAEGNQRKGYFGFDLALLPDGARISDAQFALDIESSGLGFLALVPDARFAVYGLVDGEEDFWDERTLIWGNAPANTSTGDTLDPDKVTKLGSFDIRRGAAAGLRTITGDSLVEFLNADTNGVATLIVVRETGETDKMGLVHAFASREHPTAMPPTLRLKVR